MLRPEEQGWGIILPWSRTGQQISTLPYTIAFYYIAVVKHQSARKYLSKAVSLERVMKREVSKG